MKEINVGKYKMIDNILGNDKLLNIYALLPDRDSKIEFLETLLTPYMDRLGEKFQERLEDEFEPGDYEIGQQHLRENISNKRDIKDIIRSRRRKPLREGTNERIDNLIELLRSGKYISREDEEFLVKHLSRRSYNIFDSSPSSERDRVRSILERYRDAKLKEIENDIDDRTNNLRRNALVSNSRFRMLDVARKNFSNIVRMQPKSATDNLISALNQSEELDKKKTNIDKSMLNTGNPELDIEKNSVDLEELSKILDAEIISMKKNGIKLPQRGIDENDVVEIEEPLEESNNNEEKETDDHLLENKQPQEVTDTNIKTQEHDDKPEITPEDIEEVVMIDPKALKIMEEAAATKELINKKERENNDKVR